MISGLEIKLMVHDWSVDGDKEQEISRWNLKVTYLVHFQHQGSTDLISHLLF